MPASAMRLVRGAGPQVARHLGALRRREDRDGGRQEVLHVVARRSIIRGMFDAEALALNESPRNESSHALPAALKSGCWPGVAPSA